MSLKKSTPSNLPFRKAPEVGALGRVQRSGGLPVYSICWVCTKEVGWRNSMSPYTPAYTPCRDLLSPPCKVVPSCMFCTAPRPSYKSYKFPGNIFPLRNI